MKSAWFKDIWRQIVYNPRRFIAICLMVVLGVAFFSGVRSSSPDMELTVDKYLDDYNASDIQLISTLGFDEEDVKAIRNADGVRAVMPVYTVDAFVKKDELSLLLRFQSMDWNTLNSGDPSLLNAPVLMQGAFPTQSGECLADERLATFFNYRLGDTLAIQTRNDEETADSLHVLTYTITGFVRSVQYIGLDRGTSTKGDGDLDGLVLVSQDNFTMDAYSQVYLQTTDSGDSRFSQDYDDSMAAYVKKLESVGDERRPARYQTVLSKAQQKLDDGRRQLADAKDELSDAEQQLLDGEEKLNTGRQELAAKRSEFITKTADAKKQLDNAKKQLDDTLVMLNQNCATLDQGKTELEKARQQLDDTQRQLDEGQAALVALNTQIDQLIQQRDALPTGSEAAAVLTAQIQALQTTYRDKEAEWQSGRQQADAAQQQWTQKKQELSEGETQWQQGKRQYDDGLAAYNAHWAEYIQAKTDGERQLTDAEQDIAAAQQELDEGKADFAAKKPGALADIRDAEQQLADAEAQIADLKEPKWYILTLDENEGFASYQQDTDRVAAIGLVFPLIFFLVAALVSLTNMTRMVEDDRSGIGVMKALGYSRGAIAAKYLLYAGLAALLGIGIGIVVGAELFPRVIADAYGIMYCVPPVLTPINADHAFWAALGALFCAVVPAYVVCLQELRSMPALLMRPRAPKNGRRILLERVTFIWNRLNFSHKVTCRNIFRYKKRLYMTVIGIAGCTALLFTGFGLKNSIQLMVPIQYDEIQRYDMEVTLKDADIQDLMNQQSGISEYMLTHREQLDVTANGETQTAILMVAEDREQFKQFVSLRNRRTGEALELNDEGVIITEKLAKLLNVQVGDTIRLYGDDSAEVNAAITAITENYVYHYVYLTPAVYARLYGESPVVNTVYGQLIDTSEEAEALLSETLLKNDAISAVSFNSSMRNRFDDMVDALNMVVLVLIFSAGALAFVVLFSLTNINIDERKRELATLKVLGFYDGETSMYLHRESIILTLLGVAAGLGLGVLLLSFVLSTAEVDMVMFSRRTHWSNYLLSSVITFLFAVIVNVLMNRVIKRIDMVESLKSVE